MPKTRAEEEQEARSRAADDAPPPSSQPEGAPSSRRAGEEPGRDIPTKCGAPGCGVENDKDAKFCKGCGASMSTGSEGPPVESEDEPPASDPVPPKPGSVARSASFAEIFGLPASASVPAQKAVALKWRRVVASVSKITGRTDPDEMVGELSLVARDAANAPRYRTERNALRAKMTEAERMSLAQRLVAAGEPRGNVFVDDVSADGKRTGIKLSDEITELRLKTLRAKVEGLEARKEPSNPFEPDRARSAATAAAVKHTGGADKAARIKAAESHPTVQKIFKNEQLQGGKATLTQVAEQWVETLDGGAQ